MRNVETPSLRPVQRRAGITVRRAVEAAVVRSWKKRMPSGNRTDRVCDRTRRKTRGHRPRGTTRPRPARCCFERESEESSKMRTQITSRMRDGALIDGTRGWQSIDWQRAQREVRRLQMRIAKAVREGKRSRARALQRILTRSFYVKSMAVKRVTGTARCPRAESTFSRSVDRRYVGAIYGITAGPSHKGGLMQRLSRMTRKCHLRF